MRGSRPLTRSELVLAPKVLLHDHLDGGLRPQTVIDLAEECDYRGLPTTDAAELARWFVDQSTSGGLEGYLAGFVHTLAVLQTAASLFRAATECALDLATDGVVYAEVRFAPELHQRGGLSLEEAVDAVVAGFAAGENAARAGGHPIVIRVLLSAMRDHSRSLEVAKVAAAYRGRGVVGFDLAGPEDGHPVENHRDACAVAAHYRVPTTFHAGEAHGVASIWQAVDIGHARRVGHGVRLADELPQELPTGIAELGPIASRVRARLVTLEVCPTSNLHTGIARSLEDHPIERLRRHGFLVTVNTDNRLMSGVTLSGELAACSAAFGWTGDDIEQLTLNAAMAAFCSDDEREVLIGTVTRGFDSLCASR